MALRRLAGPSETYSDDRREVQALNKGEIDYVNATRKDADHFVLVWGNSNDFRNTGVKMARGCDADKTLMSLAN